MKYKYDPPYLIKKIFPSCQWESKINKILFTFDDGPIPETTPLILETLASYKIKAAFFCVGENIYKYPELYMKIIKGGHIIGNHTFNHKLISKLKKNGASEQIRMFNDIIKQNEGDKVIYFRPPYGKFNFSTISVLKEMNLVPVMWSLLTYDYKDNLNVIKFAVKKYLKKNSIIVLHDSIKSRNLIVDSINYIVEEANRKGFQIGAPAECLK